MPRTLTTKQAWRKIARVFAEAAAGRLDWPDPIANRIALVGGLCIASTVLVGDGQLAPEQETEMDAMLAQYGGRDPMSGYWWDLTPEGHGERAMFAALMAEVAE